MRTTITFLEKPATQEEKEVAEFLNEFLQTIAGGDFSSLHNLHSTEELKVTIPDHNKHIEILKKYWHKIRSIELKDASIRITDPSVAVVNFYWSTLLIDKLIKHVEDRTLHLRKIDGKWYIV